MNSINDLERLISQLSLKTTDKNSLYSSLKKLRKENAIYAYQLEQVKEEHQSITKKLYAVNRELSEKQISINHLEKANKDLEEFSYIASHDLKSPLRTISNFAQLLKVQCGSDLPENAQESLHFITSGAKHMHEVVSDLLAFSKAGIKAKEVAPIDLNDIVDLVKLNLQSMITASKAEIILPKRLPILKVNKSNFIQLFQNLIENAIKFQGAEAPKMVITASDQGAGLWEFRVKDNGIGIPESFQEKAFQAFQRLDSVDRPGTGIGLAICKKVIHTYGGSIYYEANAEGGTTFVFNIRQNNNMSSGSIPSLAIGARV